MAYIVMRDFRREPDLTWFNGGEIQIVGYGLIFGGLALLATYILFVVPLVLLWPVNSQRKHWYCVLVTSVLWPFVFVNGVIELNSPPAILWGLRHDSGLYAWLGLFAVCACSFYLLLLRWQLIRQARSSQGSEPCLAFENSSR